MKISYRSLFGLLLACEAASVGLLACGGSDQSLTPNPQPDGGIESGGSRRAEEPPPIDASVETRDAGSVPDSSIANVDAALDSSLHDGDAAAEASNDATTPDSELEAESDAGPVGTNTTVENAQAIKPNGAPVPGIIDDPNTLSAWYKFEGKANDAWVITTSRPPNLTPDYNAYFDPIVELYDASGTTRIAAQDNPNPRTGDDPKLYVTLPRDGTYYIRVADCTAISTQCGSVPGNARAVFDLSVISFDKLRSFALDTEPNDKTTEPTPILYKGVPADEWFEVMDVRGTYDPPQTDVDVYSFTIPSTLDVPAGYRMMTGFYIQVPGDKGNGSATSMGSTSITDGQRTLASFDASKQTAVGKKPWLVAPVELGKTYYLVTKNGTSKPGYYVFRHLNAYLYPLESAADNHTLEKAEPLTAESDYPWIYYLDGNLTPGEPDFFSISVPTGYKTFVADCSARLMGSGLRGLTIQFLQPDGTPIPDGTAAPETEDSFSAARNVLVPLHQTGLIMKVSAESQSPDIAGSFYECRIVFNDPSSG